MKRGCERTVEDVVGVAGVGLIAIGILLLALAGTAARGSARQPPSHPHNPFKLQAQAND